MTGFWDSLFGATHDPGDRIPRRMTMSQYKQLYPQGLGHPGRPPIYMPGTKGYEEQQKNGGVEAAYEGGFGGGRGGPMMPSPPGMMAGRGRRFGGRILMGTRGGPMPVGPGGDPTGMGPRGGPRADPTGMGPRGPRGGPMGMGPGGGERGMGRGMGPGMGRGMRPGAGGRGMGGHGPMIDSDDGDGDSMMSGDGRARRLRRSRQANMDHNRRR
ncbi:MAG: hypothetical protein Q9190_005289 [Brigantiaea leucoxantha]